MSVPSREEYAGWTTAHFDVLASTLRAQIDRSRSWSTGHVEQIRNPGGAAWTGQAGEAASDLAERAVAVTTGRVNAAEDLVKVAERGRDSVHAAMSKLNDALSTAAHEGFEVGSDWSVSPTGTWTADTVKAAAEHADNIQYHLKSLVDTDSAIQGELTKKATELGGLKLPRPDGNKDKVFLAGNHFKQGGGAGGPQNPTINPPTKPPVHADNPNHDDLDDTIPNHPEINIGGDGKDHHPYFDDKLNPLPVPGGARAIPTGTADGPNGKKYAFYSMPPYKNPDGSDNKTYVTSPSTIVDITDPNHPVVIGQAPVNQASGAYDPVTNKMYIVGNTGLGPDENRHMYSVPVDTNNPNGWAGALPASNGPAPAGAPKWNDEGAVLAGGRENQLVRLQGGGFMLTGGDNLGSIQATTAATPSGLVNQTQGIEVVPNDPVRGISQPYGPTIVKDEYNPTTHQDTITMRISQFAPPGSPEGTYDPQLYTTQFTVNQPGQ